MTEAMVLGLAGWQKWNPSVDWDKDRWWMQKKASNWQGPWKVQRTSPAPEVRKVKAEPVNTLGEEEMG